MGMQRLPAKVLERRLGGRRQQGGFGAKAWPVGIVAQDRMADRRQMQPNLVGAAGFKPAGKEARHRLAGATALGATSPALLPAIALDRLPMGDGLTPAFPDGHAVARHL